jgi:hypothetical protein
MGAIPPIDFGEPVPPPNGGADQNIEFLAGIAALFNAINLALFQLWQFLGQVLKAIALVFNTLGKFLLHVWQRYVKKAITWLASHVQKLRAWLKRTIAPIIKRLEKIKKWYDTHILKQQLRQIQMIQRIRQFLAILRLLHIGWATKLDAALMDVQNRIEQDIALVRGTLNQIINTLALAYDPSLLIRSNVLGGSLLGNLAAVKRIFGVSWHGPLTPTETTQLDHNVGRYSESTADSHIATLSTTGLTAYDLSEVSDFRKALSDVTGKPSVL